MWVGAKADELVTITSIHGRVLWQGKQTVLHWGLYPSSEGREPWVIFPDVMSCTGYVQRPFLIKERLYLWD